MQTSSKAVSSLRVVALVLWAAASFQACGEDSQGESPSAPNCGPGTALVNGQCVVAAECGEGTVLKAGKCVPDSTASQGGSGGNQGGNGGSSIAQGGAQTGGSGTQTGGQGGSDAGSSGVGGTDLGGSGGDPAAGTGGSTLAGNGGSGPAGSGGSETGGAAQGGMSGNSGTSGSAGSSTAGEAGQGGTDGGTGGVSAGGTSQAGNGGAAGNQAGQGGSTPDDMDDPCPSEPIDFNCDPACGDVHPGCATIGCDGKIDFGPTYKKKIIIRTPPNPAPDPACDKCTYKKPYTLIMIGLPKFTGLDSWYEKFSNVTGGWVMSSGSDSPAITCMFKNSAYYVGCYSQKDFAVYGDVKIFYGATLNLRARNIVIERSTEEPVLCSDSEPFASWPWSEN